MVRSTFLIAEPRPPEGISARKLVLETALFNVITAYDGDDAMKLLEKFPNVDAIVVHSGLGEYAYTALIEAALRTKPDRLIILISPGSTARHPKAEISLSSHDPKQLLDLVTQRFGRVDV